jgi:aminoglycoside phosphotransferase (APT) family kinase protein
VVDGDLLGVTVPAQVRDAGHMLTAIHTALASCDLAIEGGRRDPGQQLVHHDYRSANLLHDGTRIVGVMDLEEIAVATLIRGRDA